MGFAETKRGDANKVATKAKERMLFEVKNVTARMPERLDASKGLQRNQQRRRRWTENAGEGENRRTRQREGLAYLPDVTLRRFAYPCCDSPDTTAASNPRQPTQTWQRTMFQAPSGIWEDAHLGIWFKVGGKRCKRDTEKIPELWLVRRDN